MDREFDVVVVGSGVAGDHVARALRRHGREVAIVDERPFGGTCVLRGCDPKKVLVHAAAVVDAAMRLDRKSVLDRTPAIRWGELLRFKRSFTDPIPTQRRESYERAGIAALHGHARFEDERSIAVDGTRLHASNIVVASGATPRGVALGDDLLIDSDGFLELDELPRSIVFVGGGFIAFEFAHVAARAGSDVTILQDDDRPLPEFDRILVDRLVDLTRDAGITVECNAPVRSVRRDGDRVAFEVERDRMTHVVHAAAGVRSAGRVPNLDALDLDRGHVERTKHGVRVDEHLRSTSNPAVYAAGDAADAGGAPLTPVAAYDAEIVVANLLHGARKTVDFRGLASIVYAIPPLGRVGLGEDELRASNAEYEVREGDMSGWYETRYVAAPAAYYRTFVEKKTGKILGATILGPHAQEQLNVIALAMRNDLPVSAFDDALFAYPSGASDLSYMF